MDQLPSCLASFNAWAVRIFSLSDLVWDKLTSYTQSLEVIGPKFALGIFVITDILSLGLSQSLRSCTSRRKVRGRDVACVAGCHLASIAQVVVLAQQDAGGKTRGKTHGYWTLSARVQESKALT